MNISQFARDYHAKMFPEQKEIMQGSDPELIERYENFAYDTVINQDDLDGKTRLMANLAVTLGCCALDEYKILVKSAMNFEVTPIEIKEIVYQAVPYLGISRVFPFLMATNEIFEELKIKMPFESQATTTMENRLEKGIAVQVEIFGEQMKDFWQSGPEETRHINKWLAENCFGDFYTRKGLDLKQREMITFCFLMAQGGCEPQLTSHAAANMRLGNDKKFLIKIVTQCLPYIGYPRSLNALRCINDAEKNK